MRIVFMGTPEFAAASLERLIKDSHDVCAVFFDNCQIAQLHMLKRRKPLSALRTLTPTPHSGIIIGIARIFNNRIITTAKRTFHFFIFLV